MTLPARSVPAQHLLDALRQCGVTFIVSVPDTHQKSLLALLDTVSDIRVITCCTEDEAVCVTMGLWIGGAPVAMMIQHAGLYACVNHLRGVGLDLKAPLLMLIGLLGRDVEKAPRDNDGSMVRLAEPLLDTLGIAHYLVDGPEDVALIQPAYREALGKQAPVAVLIGAPTA